MASARLKLALPQSAIEELKTKIAGIIILPSDASYDNVRKLNNPRFDPHPSAIVCCAAEDDIRLCLLALRQHGVEFRVRAGGHSTAGYSASDGVLIDVGGLDKLAVDAGQRTAVVGCGCKLPAVAQEIARHGLDLPLGGGRTVCIGGFVQGGGWGLTSRIFGMNCDSAMRMRVLLADGRTVEADETTNADLWWALRGGTGGNFGVLLTVEYRLHEAPALTSWTMTWDLGKAGSSTWLNEATALAALQQHYAGVGGAVSVGAAAVIRPITKLPTLVLTGMCLGTAADAELALAPLLSIPGGRFIITPTRSAAKAVAFLADEFMHVPFAPGQRAAVGWRRPSRFIAHRLAVADWQAIIDLVLGSPTSLYDFQIQCYGGAIATPRPNGGAFIHRGSGLCCYLQAGWRMTAQKKKVDTYLARWGELVEPFWNGHIYQNFPDDEYVDFQWNYWGNAFPTLLAIKQKYDPDNLFAFPQMIRPMGPALKDNPAAEPPPSVAQALLQPIAVA